MNNRPASGNHAEPMHYTPLSRPNMSAHTTDRYSSKPARVSTENRGTPFGQDVSSQQQQPLSHSYRLPHVANPTVYTTAPSHEQPYGHTRDYHGYREQAMPQRALSPPNGSGGMLSTSHFPALPPGAYVNPAFFRPDHQPALPHDIKRQMDILYNLRHLPPG